MNGTIAQIWMLLLAGGWIFIIIRHAYIIRYPFRKYMDENFHSEWKKMLVPIYGTPIWNNIYYTKTIYDFVWRSKDCFNDKGVEKFKKLIKKTGWQIMIYFGFVGINGVIMSFIDYWLKN